MTNDLTIQTVDGVINIRVALWAERDGQLLVCAYPNGIMTLPGGRVRFGESSVLAIVREIQEEAGETIENAKLIGTIENFFTLNDIPHHELLYIYKGELPANITGKDGEELYWLPLIDIDKLQPRALSKLKNAVTPMHLVQYT